MDEQQKQDWRPDGNAAEPRQPAQNESPYYNETSNQGGNPYHNGGSYQYESPYQKYGTPNSNGMVIASLVMGILSVVVICCGFSWTFGALGILFAILSRKNGPMEPQAKIGLGLSIAGTIIGIVILLVAILGNSTYYSNFMEEYERFYNEYEDRGSFNSQTPFDFDDYLEGYGDDWNYQVPSNGDTF